jgi:hypothetical protein
MRVFYRGPRALITAEAITVAHVAPCSFALADLGAMCIVREQRRGDSEARRAMGVSALVGGILVVPIVGPVAKVLAAVLVLMLFGCAIVSLRPGSPAHHELVATYRGRRVVVFESDDQREFDQVCRGLRRALDGLG